MKRQARGQALVLALFLLVVGAAALVQLFQGGQLVHEKTRLTQAADAAAYSGALVQARALNFQAYANRAQVAHQVAMAHLVTLASWARFGDTEGQRASIGNPPATVIGMLFGPAHGAAYAASRAALGLGEAARVEGSLGRAFAEHDRVVNDVLWRAQLAVLESLPAVRASAMQAVLRANYAGAAPVESGAVHLDPEPLADALPGFLAVHRGAGRARLRDLVLEAAGHYGFLDERDHTARNPWVVQPRCPHLRHELRRRGATRLEGFDVWRADDTQSYHALRSNRWIGCYYREYPMGWADVAAGGEPAPSEREHVEDPPIDFGSEDFWRWARANTGWDIFGGRGNPLANSFAVRDAIAWRGLGMPGYVDANTAAREGASLRFAIRVARPAAALGVSGGASRVSAGSSFLAMRAALPGDEMAAASAAEAYFVRPVPRADGRAELPNLFSPFWQARLAPVSEAERRAALARQGVAG